MREDIAFLGLGTTCRGWLYLPDAPASGKLPGIAMAHGFSGVKEMDLPPFAEGFAKAGFAVVLFDYRFFGASDGEPRGLLDPAAQIEDYRNALSFLAEHPRVDPGRLGVWGTSFSGAHALHLGAFDPRVRAVVSQVPAIDVQANARRLMSPGQLAGMLGLMIENRRRMYLGEPDGVIPVVALAGQPCMLPSPESYEMLLHQQATIAPNWRNEVAISSFERIMEYRPARSIELISPKPLLMIVALEDTLTPPDLALAAYGAALEPKSLLAFEGPHYAAYGESAIHDRCLAAATDWFGAHLQRSRAFTSRG